MAAQKKRGKRKIPGAGFWLVLLCLLVAVSLWVRWSRNAAAPRGPEFECQLEVLNGTGRPGLAMDTAIELRSAGIDVLVVGDAEHYRFAESILVDRRGDPELMKRLGRLLGCHTVILQVQREPLVDVTLILGKDMIGFEIPD